MPGRWTKGLIDYVDRSYGEESEENDFYAANVIANPSLKAGGETLDASQITASLLADQLQEAGEVEANVATGYHAIEFLLWGQDLNGTGAGAGNRPATDFDPANLHRRQLRSPRRVSESGDGPADFRPGRNGRGLGTGRCGARRPGCKG